jgi:hypothetical protein
MVDKEAENQESELEGNLEEELDETLSEDEEGLDDAGSDDEGLFTDSEDDDSDYDFEDELEDDQEEEQEAEEDPSDDEELAESDFDDDDQEEEKDSVEGEEQKAEDDSEFATLEDELNARIKPDFVPGSKEFFQATATEAKEAVEKELGDFDEFDPEHIARYNYFINEAQNQRKAEYQKGIEIVKNERTQRAERKTLLKKQKDAETQVDAILTTPEQKKKFGELLKSMSKNSRGEYLVLLEDLSLGKPDRLIKLAKKVAGVHGRLIDNKRPQRRSSAKRKRKGEVYGSDLLGF